MAKIPPTAGEKHLIDVIIETPKGSRNKYAWDEERTLFRLKKTLPLGAAFPFDFGYVPDTKGEDGDPTDILVIMDEPAYPGILVECYVAGALKAEQSENGRTIRNDRLIAISASSVLYKDFRTLKDLNANILLQIEHFFIFYNEQASKKFKPMEWIGAEEAMALIQKAAK